MKSKIIALFALLLIGALVYALGWTQGASDEQAKAKALEHEQLRKAFEQGRELGTVRDRVVTEYVDRVQVIEKRGQTIIKEVPIYVSEAADRACPVPAGFVRLHDAVAAGMPAPGSAGAADEAASGVALSAVAGTVAGNYTVCHENAAQLSKLQELLQKHQAITQGAKE
ncbi:TPA: hypothetical protein NHP34_006065 [Pseudomonas aeruginosa]|nr:hypothetical protein [Pseudomonas aeruginosa]